jgi:triosephosphate isomerase (TIM)
MPERTQLLAANWKMHKTRAEARAFLDSFLPAAPEIVRVDVAICPPFTALEAVIERCGGATVLVAAQNAHHESAGAFTGEVSATMLAELGAWGAIVGHSERRRLFGESDDALARKVPALLDGGLVPILCVGETEGERDGGRTEEVLRRQLEADLAGVEPRRLADVVIAYEPVWAIGTGRTATVPQAVEAIGFIRSLVGARFEDAAEAIRILYGGSVNAENAGELLDGEGIDGALVGGASLDPEEFLAICRATGQ